VKVAACLVDNDGDGDFHHPASPGVNIVSQAPQLIAIGSCVARCPSVLETPDQDTGTDTDTVVPVQYRHDEIIPVKGSATLHNPEGDASLEPAPTPVPTTPRQTSRRTVLGGLGVSLALPLLPLSLLELCTVASAAGNASEVMPADPPSTPVEQASLIPQPIPTAVQAVATGAISVPTGTLPDFFMGLSYEKGAFAGEPLFTATNTSLVALFNLLGKGILALGGNTLDETLWTPDGPGATIGQVSPVDVDHLAAFIAFTDWKVLYGVNLGTSTPALAAAEVAYVQAKLGGALLGFQIGNEPDEYFLSYFPAGWDLAAFEALWEQFRSAILATTPTATITGPASGGAVTTWTVPFVLGPNGKLISLLTQHYYRGNGHSASATVKNLISPDPAIIASCVALRSAVSGLKIPFRFSETNSYLYGGAPGLSDAYASALWVIDHLFHIALGGGDGVNMQGGDMGYYTPIANSGSTILEARPEYYGLLLFSLAGQGTLLETKLSTTNLNVTMYAVLTPSGVTNIVIVNKEVYLSLKITIHCGEAIHSAELIELRGTALTATEGQTLQGATIGSDGSIEMGAPYSPANISSAWVTCYVPAISAVLLRVS
jgi:hypothetical protein